MKHIVFQRPGGYDRMHIEAALRAIESGGNIGKLALRL